MQATKLNKLSYEFLYGKNENIDILIASDIHFDNPHCDRELFFSHLDRIRKKKGKVFIIGDLFCFMQGKYDPRRNKSDIRPEHNKADYINAVINDTVELLSPYKDIIAFVSDGNHECYDGETEILTNEGWKLFRDLNKNELVATMNMETKVVEWQKPYNYHVSYFSGKMHSVKSRAINWMITPNHRIVYKPQGVDEYKFKESRDFSFSNGSSVVVPVSGVSGKNDLKGISDNELRLMAWVITDGHIRKEITRVEIYQSGDKHKIIKDLLNELEFDYKLSGRDRNIKEIDGTVLVKPPKTNYTFRLNGEGRARVFELFEGRNRKHFPDWLHHLSDRQFEVFLKEYIKGDGSIHPSAESSWMAYGTKPELEKLQILCVTHGYKASLSEYREAQYRLNITKHLTYEIRGIGERFSEVDYKDFVYCVTVPNHTLFVRRKGQVFVSGNTALLKNIEVDVLNEFVIKYNTINKTNILKGGYRGWIIIRKEVSGRSMSHKMYYNHGYGGGGEMSKGILQHSRMNMHVEGADAIIMGHVHEAYVQANKRVYFNNNPGCFNEKERIVWNLRSACYKEEFVGSDSGFHIEKGRPPKPLGGIYANLEAARSRDTNAHTLLADYTMWIE